MTTGVAGMKYAKLRRVVWTLSLVSFAWSLSLAQTPPDRPASGSGIPLDTVLALPDEEDGCDLCERTWSIGLMVAQDRKDRLFVLDPEKGECEIFSSKGKRLDTFRVNDWTPLQRSYGASFAVASSGRELAAASGNKIALFSRDEVELYTSLPTFVTSLAFSGDLVVAKFPVVLPAKKGQGFTRAPHLLAWLERDGTIGAEALAADPARGPDPMSIAMTQGVEVAADPGGDLWVVDQTRVYRVRRVSSSGRVMATWVSDRLNAPVSFSGETPEEVSEDRAGSFRPVNARRVGLDAVARDGFLWILVNGDDGSQMVDVFDDDLAGPVARFTLPDSWRHWQIAVGSDAIWAFPLNDRGVPLRLERPQDWEIREIAYSTMP